MKSSQQLAAVVLLIAGTTLAPATVNYAADPYQIFEARDTGLDELMPNARFQVAGLIRSYLADPQRGFDTILVGTSHSMNYSPAHIQETLQCGRVLKLAMAGAQPATDRAVAGFALQQPTVRRVLWELGSLYAEPRAGHVRQWGAFPAYLYGEDLDLTRYLFNVDIFAEALGWVPDEESNTGAQGDAWNSWFLDEETWKLNRLKFQLTFFPRLRPRLAEHQPTRPAGVTGLRELAVNMSYPRLELAAEIVEAHPDVQFDFFFTPYSILRYASRGNEELARLFFMRRRALHILGELPNVRIHTFDAEADVVTDLDLYKDQGHFHPSVNPRIVEAIADGSRRLTHENLYRHETAWYQLIREYELPEGIPR